MRETSLREKLLTNQEDLRLYGERKLSANDIAVKYGYVVSYVMSTLSKLGAKRSIDPESTYQVQRRAAQLAEMRREFRQFLAQKVVKGEMDLEKAAEIADCSPRTIRRYVEKQ